MSRNSTFTPMHTVLKPAAIFDWAIEHYEVTKEQSQMTAINMHSGNDFVPPGKYTRLVNGRTVWMSDTDMEQRTNYGVVNKAKGDVLIAGLGLGMVLVPILAKPEVRHVTVLEKYPEVRKLVEVPLLMHLGTRTALKLTVIDADVHTWKPPAGQKWDCIYFDIWASQSTDTLQEIATLKRRFARRKAEGGWMGAWREDELRYRRRQGNW